MEQLGNRKILQFFWYSLPLAIILTMVWLVKSPLFESNANQLAPAVTIDLLLTLPLVYFLIIRKKSIPKTTTVLVLGIGVLIASLILPKHDQWLLNYAKIWLLPLVELLVITYVFFTIRKSVRAFKSSQNNATSFDFHTNLKEALSKIIPVKAIPFVAMEISVFYYGFIRWKKLTLNQLEFSYHRESGTKAALLILILIIGVETFAFHILLINSAQVLAWILTGLSIYSGFQIYGIYKSLNRRPIRIETDKIHLRYGIIAEAEIDMGNIKSIQPQKGEINKESGTISFSPFGNLEGHNVLFELERPIMVSGLYGVKRHTNYLALFVDNPKDFISAVQMSIK